MSLHPRGLHGLNFQQQGGGGVQQGLGGQGFEHNFGGHGVRLEGSGQRGV